MPLCSLEKMLVLGTLCMPLLLLAERLYCLSLPPHFRWALERVLVCVVGPVGVIFLRGLCPAVGGKGMDTARATGRYQIGFSDACVEV
uniref:Uncharacterized protein n=1 Tax=Knipowitschia caucasica TaxID=637954 RepID=A0AAV2LCM6_KNICA